MTYLIACGIALWVKDKRKDRVIFKAIDLFFRTELQLICNFEYVSLVDANYRVLLVCEDVNFDSTFTFCR